MQMYLCKKMFCICLMYEKVIYLNPRNKEKIILLFLKGGNPNFFIKENICSILIFCPFFVQENNK